ncbi:putative RNA-directed DNA polymerase [Tanacetum coccineum]
MQFLTGLDDVEESHRVSSSSSSGNNKAQASVFAAKVHNNNNFKKNSDAKNPNLVCTNPNCGLTGHTIEKCYKIVGYPEHIKKKWANNRNNNNQRSFSLNNSSTNTAEIPTSTAPSLTRLTLEENSEDWLGHLCGKVLKALKDRIDIRGNGDSAPCDICHQAKQIRESFLIIDRKTTNLGDVVHLDVWGPYKIISGEGYKYFLTVVDNYSRAIWLYLLKGKDEVTSNVIEFYNYLKNEFNKTVKNFRSDNGTKFANSNMNSFFKQHGIIHFEALVDIAEGIENTAKTCVRLIILKRIDKAEIGEIRSIGPELVQETTNKVILIKEKLKAARDCQKSYVGNMRKHLELKLVIK